MAKLNAEQRINAIKRYLHGNESIENIARSIGISSSILSGWIRLYESHGQEAFFKSYTNYPAEFKMDVLTYMNETGASSFDAAAIFNISSPGMIRNWRITFEKGGFDALISKKKGWPSMKKETNKSAKPSKTAKGDSSVEALEARIRQLEMENAYLKKLNALVQMQEKLQPKSKRK